MAQTEYTKTVNGQPITLVLGAPGAEPPPEAFVKAYIAKRERGDFDAVQPEPPAAAEQSPAAQPPDVTEPARTDTSQGFVGPPAPTAAETLKSALVDPLVKAGSMFVPEPGAPRPQMSEEEQRVIDRAQYAATGESPLQLAPALTGMQPGSDVGVYENIGEMGRAITPDFLQRMMSDVAARRNPILDRERAAEFESPIFRAQAELAYDLLRDVDEEEQEARDWARGAKQPGEGIAGNLAVTNPLLPKQQRARLGIAVPPPEESIIADPGVVAGTVAGRVKGLAQGAGEELGSEIEQYKEKLSIHYARMVRHAAMEAKKRGDATVRMPFSPFSASVDRLLADPEFSEEKAALDYARLNTMRSSIEEASSRLSQRLNDKLAESPGLVSWHTVKNWREAVGEMASGVGGVLLYLGGMTELPETVELDERGRYKTKVEDAADAFLAADAAAQVMGGELSTEAIAGFATNVHLDTMMSALEVDGPAALLDILPYLAYAKAAVAAGKIKLPASVARKLDYVLEVAEPMRDYIAQAGGDKLKRLVGEAGANRERLATEFYDEITRTTREEQAAVDSALKQVASMVDEGYELGLARADDVAERVEAPTGDPLEIMSAEKRGFDDRVEQLTRERVEEAGGLVVPDIVPDEVRQRANARVFDENAVTDSVRGNEILLEELEKYEAEFGRPTREVDVPGTKRVKGQPGEKAQLNEQQSAVWDKVNDKYDELVDKVRSKAKGIDRRFTNKARAATAKQDLSKEIARLEAQRKAELNEVIEGFHDDLQQRFEARRDRTERIRQEARLQAAQEVVERRSPWGMKVRRDVPELTPIGSNVWTAQADVYPKEGTVSLRVPTSAQVEQYSRMVDQMDIPAAEKTNLKNQYQGHGIYRGEEFKGPGKPKVTPRIVAAPEIMSVVRRIVESVGKTDADRYRLLGEIEANIARSIDQQLPEFLRSKTARERLSQELVGVIQKRISKQGPLDKATRNALVTSIYRTLEEVGAGKTPESGQPGSALPLNIDFFVKHPNGKVSKINMLDEVANLVFKDKRQAQTIMTESLVQTARRQSIRRSQQTMQTEYVEMIDPIYDYARNVSGQTGKPTDAPTAKSEVYRGVASQLTEKSLPASFAARGTDMKGMVDSLLENADSLEELRKFLAKDKDKGGVGREFTADELTRALKRVRRRADTYVDISTKEYDSVRTLLRVGDDLYDATRAQDVGRDVTARKAAARRTVDIQAKPLMGLSKTDKLSDGSFAKRPGGLFMQKNLANALSNYGKTVESAKSADKFMKASVFVKSNLTARQLTTLKNNVMSNVILQTVRRGDPLLLPRLVTDFVKYKMYERGGKGLSDADIEMYQALTDSGKINTSFVDAEIAAMNQGGWLGDMVRQGEVAPKYKTFVDKLQYPLKQIENVYKFSDEMFKIEEGVRSYKQIKRWMNTLDEGDYMTLRLGPVKRVKLRKVTDAAQWEKRADDPDFAEISPTPFERWHEFADKREAKRRAKFSDNVFEVDGKVVDGAQLNAILGKAAMQVGEDLFFNYFDVGDLARVYRNSSMFALASPFYTWFSKAIDIPLVKRGLLSEIYRGAPWVKTNNAKILLELAANQSRIGATMDLAAAYARQSPYDEETMKMLRKSLGWGRGTQMGVFNAEAYTDLVGGYVSLNQANPWGPTDLIFRAIENGIGFAENIERNEGGIPLPAVGFLGDDAQDFIKLYERDGALDFDLKDMDPKERKKVMDRRRFMLSRATGETGIGLGDGLDLVGLAGHPILEMWHLKAESQKRDKDVSWASFAMRVANMMMGGTYAKAADGVLGAVDPDNPFTTRYKFEDAIAGEEEAWLRGAIRKVTGIGWKPANVQKRGEKYFDRLEQKWDDALVARITADIKKLEQQAASKFISRDRELELEKEIENAKTLKGRMREILKREVDDMRKKHQELYIKMRETKTRQPVEVPYKPRTGTLNVIQGAR